MRDATETERTLRLVRARRMHLVEVQQARADLILAEARLRTARRSALAGGCTIDEVADAVAMIDRAAEMGP